MRKGKFAKEVSGPEGLFRVDVQDAEGNKCVWSVEKIFGDDNMQGSTLKGVYKTRGDAVEAAHQFAALSDYKPTPLIPRVDRRGLVAHSRKRHG
jgi:hypothetical protein